MSVNLTWLAIGAILVSLVTVLFGGLWIAEPLSRITDFITGKVIFLWVLLFRMIIWQTVMITLDKFFPLLALSLLLMNLCLVFVVQRRIQLDPINYSLLTIVFPVYKLPSLALSETLGVRYLLGTILTGNLANLIAFVVIYILYDANLYVPWCSALQKTNVFPEYLYQFSIWPVVTLFCAASIPSAILLLFPLRR